MNCCVLEFVAEDDNGIFPSFFMRRNADTNEEDLAELIWPEGPAVLRRIAPETPSALPSRADSSVWSYPGATPVSGTELFTEEDEMAAWLDYTLGEDEGGGGLGGVVGHHLPEKTPAAGRVQALDRDFQADVGGWAASGRPPLPPEVEGKLSLSHRDREPNAAAAAADSMIVVGSSMTPPWLLAREHALESRTSSGDGGGGTGKLEHGHTLSSGGFCEDDATVKAAPPREDRKRKAQGDDSDCNSEDAEFESSDLTKEGSCRMIRSASKRRSRAAAVHNLSERRRRDRINEKMKALQQLIPRCNKSDKASMLDDAIEYLKALQMQVHMMSVGCNMIHMMFPGMQQYVPPTMGMAIPMGMSMGMGMGMEMGAGALNHPMAPFLPVMSGAHMVPTGAAAAAPPLGTGVSMQPFHAPAAGFSDPVKLHATGQTDLAACPAAAAPAGAAQAPDHYSHPCSQQCQYAGLISPVASASASSDPVTQSQAMQVERVIRIYGKGCLTGPTWSHRAEWSYPCVWGLGQE